MDMLNQKNNYSRYTSIRLILILVLISLPGWLTAQEMSRHAVSNGAASVSGGDITGYASAGEMASFLSIDGQNVTASGFFISDVILSLTINPDEILNVLCNGGNDGSISVTIDGGQPPYTYAWTKQDDPLFTSADEDLSGLLAGTYILTVTDSKGSSASESFLVNEPEVLVATAGGTNVLCFGGSDGTATVAVTGGIQPYTYLWSNGETTQSLTGLTVGTYDVTVTDAHGCIALSTYIVTQPSAVRPNAEPVHISCYGGSDGSIDLSKASGGVGPYMYKLDGGAYHSDPLFTELDPGMYQVWVIDTNGCEAFEDVEIIEPPLLEIVLESIVPTCASDASGSIDVTIIGGTGKVSYLWNWPDGSNSVKEDPSGLMEGLYTITVTDDNGCVAVSDFLVEVAAAPVISGIVTDATCYRGENGAIDISVIGDGPFTYSWSGHGVNGTTTEDLNNISAGTYTITVSNAGGCETQSTFEVFEPPVALSATFLTTSIDGCGETGSITIFAEGGLAPYEYSLDGIVYNSNDVLEGLSEGEHEVYIRDQYGCILVELVEIGDTGFDSYEPNGSIRKNPPSIDLGIEVVARVAPVRDVDYYSFTTNEAGTYILSLYHPLAFEFEIYADSKTRLTPTADLGTGKEYNLDANTEYFIMVSGGAAKFWSYDCYSMYIEESGLKIGVTASDTGLNAFQALAYPNPHNGSFSLVISSDENGSAEIELFNSLGQKLDEKQVNVRKGKDNKIDYKSVRQELLFYRVTMNGKVLTGQIVSD